MFTTIDIGPIENVKSLYFKSYSCYNTLLQHIIEMSSTVINDLLHSYHDYESLETNVYVIASSNAIAITFPP